MNSQIKYQVFISSTYKDLVGARSEVIAVILKLYQIPLGMEMFSADNDEQWEVIKDTIDNSDYYLLIIGHRYGSLTKEKISYTEKEFNYAKSKNIPILAFIRDREVATKPEERDSDIKLQDKLDKFLAKVTKNAMCDFWSTESDLGQKVAIALPKFFHKKPRTGWVKADKAVSQAVSEELVFLGRENRALKEQLDQLRTQAIISKPSFSIKINEAERLDFKINRGIVNEYNLLKEYNYYNLPNRYKGIVTEEDIEYLNEAVRNNVEDAQTYNKDLHLYEIIKYHRKRLTIEVTNTGKVKANDVVVELTFPDQLLIMKEEKAEAYHAPEKPKNIFARTPHELEEAQKYLSFGSGSSYSIKNNLRAYPNRANLNGSTLDRSIKSILHTRTHCIDDDFVIVPMIEGEFEIQASIICEELSEKIEFTIPVLVSKN